MSVFGIVAEYNPFHNGHKYQLAQVKKQKHCDLVIVAMSGNFLQRGEPAIFSKWQRANWAVQHGADLVIELPVAFASQPADYFAQGGVSLLNALKVDTLAFGCESGSQSDYLRAAQYFIDHEETIRSSSFNRDRSLTYPQWLTQVLTEEFQDFPLDLNQPNNMLGFAYTKQVALGKYPMDILPLKRLGAGYHDTDLSGQKTIASATAIRRAIFQGESVGRFLPYKESAYQDLKPVKTSDLWPFIRYQLFRISESDLKEIYQMAPGLEVHLKEAALKAKTYEDFMDRAHSKHLTRNQVKRLLLYTLLEMKEESVQKTLDQGPGYIRPLALNQRGQAYLNQVKHQVNLPLISRVGQKEADLLNLDIKAGDLYRLIHPQEIAHQDFGRNPFQTIDNSGPN